MLTIYCAAGSPYGRAALVVCAEKGVPHRLEPLGPRMSKTPEHLARHPFGRMPAIDHDGFGLYETQAILRYVDAVGQGPSLTPADPRAAARMNQAMGVIDWYFFADGSAKSLVFNRLVGPKFGLPTSEEDVAASLPRTKLCVEVLSGFLEQTPYVAGDSLTLGDIHAGCHVDFLTDTPEGAELVKGTALETWLERLRARPSFQTTTWDALLKAA